jgi:hypothetical protein
MQRLVAIMTVCALGCAAPDADIDGSPASGRADTYTWKSWACTMNGFFQDVDHRQRVASPRKITLTLRAVVSNETAVLPLRQEYKFEPEGGAEAGGTLEQLLTGLKRGYPPLDEFHFIMSLDRKQIYAVSEFFAKGLPPSLHFTEADIPHIQLQRAKPGAKPGSIIDRMPIGGEVIIPLGVPYESPIASFTSPLDYQKRYVLEASLPAPEHDGLSFQLEATCDDSAKPDEQDQSPAGDPSDWRKQNRVGEYTAPAVCNQPNTLANFKFAVTGNGGIELLPGTTVGAFSLGQIRGTEPYPSGLTAESEPVRPLARFSNFGFLASPIRGTAEHQLGGTRLTLAFDFQRPEPLEVRHRRVQREALELREARGKDEKRKVRERQEDQAEVRGQSTHYSCLADHDWE